MYNDMVGDFGTFGGYICDSFRGNPNHVNTMVIPHPSTTSTDNNKNGNNNMVIWVIRHCYIRHHPQIKPDMGSLNIYLINSLLENMEQYT